MRRGYKQNLLFKVLCLGRRSLGETPGAGEVSKFSQSLLARRATSKSELGWARRATAEMQDICYP